MRSIARKTRWLNAALAPVQIAGDITEPYDWTNILAADYSVPTTQYSDPVASSSRPAMSMGDVVIPYLGNLPSSPLEIVPISVQEVQAKVDIAKTLIPELFVASNTTEQSVAIIDRVKAESLATILVAQPTAPIAEASALGNADLPALVQLANAVKANPEISIPDAISFIKNETAQIVADIIEKPYQVPQVPTFTTPVVISPTIIPDATPKVTAGSTISSGIKTSLTGAGFFDSLFTSASTTSTAEKDKTILYIAGGVIVLGSLFLLFKK